MVCIILQGDTLKVEGFDFAKMGADFATAHVGTPITMAPEVLHQKDGEAYTNKIDLWSIGIVFYMMLYIMFRIK